MFVYGLVLCFFVVFGQSDASAIPMWEYLSKQEKMSFLYSMFANQVENFCDTSTMENCNQKLLKYGLDKLKTLPEEYMDAMDPYQRGASNIIWDSMMAGHPMADAIPKPRSTTTPKPNSYDDEIYSDFDDLGSQSAASAKIDHVFRVPPPKEFLEQYQRPKYTYPHNVVTYLQAFDAPVKKGPYARFQEQHGMSVSTTTEKILVDPMDEGMYEEAPLTGPMVVRVYPDGRPVKDDAPLPQDEDLRQYQMSKLKIPNL
ncbi:unnamed protein product [Phaedon cochleariae]|uniref:Rhythmically expressed gene 5 protein n=1 Tax=Phaedon cochleariae TaxID=80249 RepID=A0A9P0DDY2_PHACE|nr:unnamed protein product [Phaedon cochleariae]